MASGAEKGGFDSSAFQQIGVKSEIGDNKRVAGDQDVSAKKADNNESVDFAAMDAKIESDQKKIDDRNKQVAEHKAKHEARMTMLKAQARINDEKDWHETRAKYGLPPKEFPVPKNEEKQALKLPDAVDAAGSFQVEKKPLEMPDAVEPAQALPAVEAPKTPQQEMAALEQGIKDAENIQQWAETILDQAKANPSSVNREDVTNAQGEWVKASQTINGSKTKLRALRMKQIQSGDSSNISL